MYYGSGTVAHTASQWCQMWRARGFSWNDVMATALKVWHHIRNPTLSIHAYSLKEHSCQIPFQSDLKRWSV